jgi:hypothetical protein
MKSKADILAVLARSRRERRLQLRRTHLPHTCRTPATLLPRRAALPRARSAAPTLCPALVLSLPSAGAQGLMARRTF